ncbi:MAG: BON domain-containing protein [Burkholderiales bacterium]|nr:MAG: BON domain-containing protein [Burkholderiales bacterium]
MIHRHRKILAIAVPALILAAGCQRTDDIAGQAVDHSVAQPTDRADASVRDIPRETASAGGAVSEAARDGAQAAGTAARNAGEAVGDASITAAVKAELMKEPALGALSINVDTDDAGRVTLSGEVPSTAVKDRAEALARATPGVREVRNELLVKPA